MGRYIELNPVRAQIVTKEELQSYSWSSAKVYLSGVSDKLISIKDHPSWGGDERFNEKAINLYKDYLQIPSDDDMVIFRSQSSCIGDESFLGQIVNSIGGRIKLRRGRPKKAKGGI